MISYLWKRKGGAQGGGARLGAAVKASGLVRYFSNGQIVIWLAADHVRDARFTPRQIEALLFHELLHVAIDEETGEITLLAHDFEGFRSEIEEYGFWRPSAKSMAKAFQLALALEEGEPGMNG